MSEEKDVAPIMAQAVSSKKRAFDETCTTMDNDGPSQRVNGKKDSANKNDEGGAGVTSGSPLSKAICKSNMGGATKESPSSPEINAMYVEQSFKDCMRTAFKDGIEASHLGTQTRIINDPFMCCVLPQFLGDEGFLRGLKAELSDLNFNEKSNDLYKFQQSDALQNFSSPYISALKKVLYEDFLSWLREVSGIPFTDKFDLTCSMYNYTDVLLCHDDELEGRRVAFILYLVPPWKQADGGSLDLFDMDEHGQPRSVVKSLIPKWNNFVFFEVTPKSFHQVAEVLSESKCRLSISGWFHGPTVPRPPPYVQPHCILTPHLEIEESLFYTWVSASYLDVMYQGQIQETFSDESEIQLPNFLETEKFKAVDSALLSESVRWIKRGPANKRNYEIADPDSLPPVVRECISVMQSEFFFLLLSNCTALRLHEMAPCSSDDEEDKEERMKEEKEGEEKEEKEEGDDGQGEEGRQENVKTVLKKMEEDIDAEGGSIIAGEKDHHGNSSKESCEGKPSTPRCRAEVRRWTHGSYTLIHDTDTEGSEYALDASLFFNAGDFTAEHGGYASYIARGEDEELLSVLPEDNSLSLVYRDKDTLRFVKHINHSFIQCRQGTGSDGQSQPAFYELYLVYYE